MHMRVRKWEQTNKWEKHECELSIINLKETILIDQTITLIDNMPSHFPVKSNIHQTKPADRITDKTGVCVCVCMCVCVHMYECVCACVCDILRYPENHRESSGNVEIPYVYC